MNAAWYALQTDSLVRYTPASHLMAACRTWATQHTMQHLTACQHGATATPRQLLSGFGNAAYLDVGFCHSPWQIQGQACTKCMCRHSKHPWLSPCRCQVGPGQRHNVLSHLQDVEQHHFIAGRAGGLKLALRGIFHNCIHSLRSPLSIQACRTSSGDQHSRTRQLK